MYNTFDCQIADDSPVPFGGTINKVKVIGAYLTGGPADGSKFPAGIYLYRLQAGEIILTKKMINLK